MVLAGFDNCPPQPWTPGSSGAAETRFSVKGKRAAVTGGASGLGLDAAHALLEHGLEGVYLIDIDADKLVATASDLSKLFPNSTVTFEVVDISDQQKVKESVANAFKIMGKVDILLSFAGIAPVTSVTGRPDADQWTRTQSVNINGNYYVCKEFGEEMIKQEVKGSIIIASSIGGHGRYGINNDYQFPIPHDYIVAKTAVHGLRTSLATTFCRYGIRVNTISPGAMETPMTRKLLAVKELRDAWYNAIPMARIGSQGEANGAILLLASDAGSYITGADIRIDGGLSTQV